jgi:hypothetical protein
VAAAVALTRPIGMCCVLAELTRAGAENGVALPLPFCDGNVEGCDVIIEMCCVIVE